MGGVVNVQALINCRSSVRSYYRQAAFIVNEMCRSKLCVCEYFEWLQVWETNDPIFQAAKIFRPQVIIIEESVPILRFATFDAKVEDCPEDEEFMKLANAICKKFASIGTWPIYAEIIAEPSEYYTY